MAIWRLFKKFLAKQKNDKRSYEVIMSETTRVSMEVSPLIPFCY